MKLIITLFLCLITAVSAEDFKAETFKSLPYRIHIPDGLDKSKKYPLIIFFHGAGERGDDNKRQLVHGCKELLAYSKKTAQNAIIIAPQCAKKKQWVDTPWGALSHTMPKQPSEQMQLAVDLLKSKVKELPVDEGRIYVSGLSMGGYGTWDIIQRMPEYFAAAIPVCGGGDTAQAAKLKNLPIWVFHGGNDKVVKTSRSRDMVAAIKKVKGKVKYTEYPGVGHNSWSPTFKNDEVLKWLFEQKK